MDVSKRHLDLAIASNNRNPQRRYDYDASGMTQLIQQLKAERVQRVVFEATGGLEWSLMEALD